MSESQVLEKPLVTGTELEILLNEILGDKTLKAEQAFGDLVVSLRPEDILSACQKAKNDKRLDFDYLRCLSCVEYPDSFELVYHLYSIREHHKLVFKSQVPKDGPAISSVTSVWQGADWHEREAADLFGVSFMGHPNPKPLLLGEDDEDHPFLKNSPLVNLRGSSVDQ